jgi:hypothetical protein
MKKIVLIIYLCSMVFVSCGYRLSGTGRLFPGHIKSIFIPDFENKTTRYQAEQFVTFAVREEFIKRSKLVLVDGLTKADSLLEGVIKKFEVRPLSYGEDASANFYNIIILLAVKFVDLKTNNIIFEDIKLKFTKNYEIDSGDFFSQETEAIIKISEEFASSIVSTILENF